MGSVSVNWTFLLRLFRYSTNKQAIVDLPVPPFSLVIAIFIIYYILCCIVYLVIVLYAFYCLFLVSDFSISLAKFICCLSKYFKTKTICGGLLSLPKRYPSPWASNPTN